MQLAILCLNSKDKNPNSFLFDIVKWYIFDNASQINTTFFNVSIQKQHDWKILNNTTIIWEFYPHMIFDNPILETSEKAISISLLL